MTAFAPSVMVCMFSTPLIVFDFSFLNDIEFCWHDFTFLAKIVQTNGMAKKNEFS